MDWSAVGGTGWSPMPPIMVTDQGAVASPPGNWYDLDTPQGSQDADSGSTMGGMVSGVTGAIAHPTTHQVLFFIAIVALVIAWRMHLISIME